MDEAPTRFCTDPAGELLSLYYHDGTVVLQANTSVFRVYAGQLAGQSTIFRDLFHFGKAEAGEMYDGCPLVHLHDDPLDLWYFLKAVHEHR